MRYMRQTEQKALDYLKSNPIVANFIEKVNKERKEYYDKINLSSKEPDLGVTKVRCSLIRDSRKLFTICK